MALLLLRLSIRADGTRDGSPLTEQLQRFTGASALLAETLHARGTGTLNLSLNPNALGDSA